jgi:hypothetical protein
LSFILKLNNHGKEDWRWLLARIEKRISCRCNRWISRGSRLSLVKSVLEVILVYWHLLAYIPKGVLTSIREICFNYLWKNSVEFLGSYLVTHKKLSKPKSLGGWGLKDLYSFGKALEGKSLWVFITWDNLWRCILIDKYICLYSIIEWIRCSDKSLPKMSPTIGGH